MKKVQWGVLGAAIIAVEQMIPAIIDSHHGQISAIASRSITKAEEVARRFRIPKAYQGYESLLKDPDIDAIYIPLPNHLHVCLAIEALRSGNHFFVYKPIAFDATEVHTLSR